FRPPPVFFHSRATGVVFARSLGELRWRDPTIDPALTTSVLGFADMVALACCGTRRTASEADWQEIPSGARPPRFSSAGAIEVESILGGSDHGGGATLLEVSGDPAACFWLDITAPSFQDLAILARAFQIHPLTIEDILAPDTREKCEVYR